MRQMRPGLYSVEEMAEKSPGNDVAPFGWMRILDPTEFDFAPSRPLLMIRDRKSVKQSFTKRSAQQLKR